MARMIPFLLMIYLVSNCSIGQPMVDCKDYEIDIRLFHGGEEIDGFDTSCSKLGEFKDTPDSIDVAMTLYNTALLNSKSSGSVAMEVTYIVRLSESPDCLFALNPIESKKNAILKKVIKNSDFPTSGPNKGSMKIALHPIDLRAALEFEQNARKKKLYVIEVLVSVSNLSLDGKGKCNIEYRRQLCTQKPVSRYHGL